MVQVQTHPHPPRPQPCIRCGWCVQRCAAGVHPAGLLEAAQQEDLEMAERFGLRACMECGECELACPSHLPLRQARQKLRDSSSSITDPSSAKAR